jgi:hypothetical protein
MVLSYGTDRAICISSLLIYSIDAFDVWVGSLAKYPELYIIE